MSYFISRFVDSAMATLFLMPPPHASHARAKNMLFRCHRHFISFKFIRTFAQRCYTAFKRSTFAVTFTYSWIVLLSLSSTLVYTLRFFFFFLRKDETFGLYRAVEFVCYILMMATTWRGWMWVAFELRIGAQLSLSTIIQF